MSLKPKIIECKKCGGYVELNYYRGCRMFICPWCGRKVAVRRCKKIKDFEIPEKAIEVLSNYFSKEEINQIIPVEKSENKKGSGQG